MIAWFVISTLIGSVGFWLFNPVALIAAAYLATRSNPRGRRIAYLCVGLSIGVFALVFSPARNASGLEFLLWFSVELVAGTLAFMSVVLAGRLYLILTDALLRKVREGTSR